MKINPIARRTFLFLALSIFFTGCSEAPEDKAKEDAQKAADVLDTEKIGAYVMAQEFVNDKLKSPGSAKYPDYDPSYVAVTSPNHYSIKSYVDSQNGLAVLVRSDWSVEIDKEGDKYHLDGINITQRE